MKLKNNSKKNLKMKYKKSTNSIKGFVDKNIEKSTNKNKYFRKVLYTTKQMQLVLMSLKPNEEIGSEIHPNTSQFIRVESGNGTSILGNKRYKLKNDSAIIIPSGVKHNVIAGKNGMKMYTIYSPPEHKPKTKLKTKPKTHH